MNMSVCAGCDRCPHGLNDTSTDEIRTVSSTGGEKGVKLARFDLLPATPLRQVAEHFGRGAQKYEDRNWERGYEWSKSYGALQRHANAFWSGEDIDEETGSPHMAAVVFHALALLEFARTHADFDDRPFAFDDRPHVEEPLADWERELLAEPSTETPRPEGCIVTVTGDSGEAGHEFPNGAVVRVLSPRMGSDGTLKCEYLDGHDYWWIFEVDLA